MKKKLLALVCMVAGVFPVGLASVIAPNIFILVLLVVLGIPPVPAIGEAQLAESLGEILEAIIRANAFTVAGLGLAA